MRIILFVLMLVSFLFAGPSDVVVTTSFKTVLDMKTGKTTVTDYSSTFTFKSDRFIHEDSTITSLYRIDLSSGLSEPYATVTVGSTDFIACPVISEARNHYFYIFDFKNKRIFVITEKDYMIQFDMRDVIIPKTSSSSDESES